jgi:hypothetical protein
MIIHHKIHNVNRGSFSFRATALALLSRKNEEYSSQRYYDLNYRDYVVLWPDGVRGLMAGWLFE